MVCSCVGLGGSHRLSLPKATFSLSPGTSQHPQRLPVGWLGCVGRPGSFPPGSSSPALRSCLPAAAARVLQSLLVDTSFPEWTRPCRERAVSTVVPAPVWCSGAAGRPLLPLPGQKDFLEFADMDPESSEAAMGGGPEEREGRCGTARPALDFVNWGRAEAGCPEEGASSPCTLPCPREVGRAQEGERAFLFRVQRAPLVVALVTFWCTGLLLVGRNPRGVSRQDVAVETFFRCQFCIIFERMLHFVRLV